MTPEERQVSMKPTNSIKDLPIRSMDQISTLVDLTTVDRVNQRQFAGASILLHCGRTVGEYPSYRPSAFASYCLQPLDLILIGKRAIWR